MARSYFSRMAILAIILATTQIQAGLSDDPKPQTSTQPSARWESTCVIYSLGALGGDPSLGEWIAKTIPAMIKPGTWEQAGGQGRLTYHAPSQVLAIAHTTAVHGQVDIFLKDLKNAREKGRATAVATPQVIPAHYMEPAVAKGLKPVKASSYPVPAPLEQPKHLFHFIIRYEGDGIVDANVAGLLKELSAGNAWKAEAAGKADKTALEPANPSPLKQLLHFIVRYEGDGIIDANVAGLLKAIYSEGGGKNYPGVAPVLTPPAGVQPQAAPNGTSAPTGTTYGPSLVTPSSTPPLSSLAPARIPSGTPPSTTPPSAEPTSQNP